MAFLEFFRSAQYLVDVERVDVRASLCAELDITPAQLERLISRGELADAPGIVKWLDEHPEMHTLGWMSRPEDPAQIERSVG